MEIKWHGNSCFTLKDKENCLVVNPNKEAGKLKGNVVLTSLENPAQVTDSEKIIDWPGEYEIKEVHITGFQAWTKSKSKEEEEGQAGDSTLIFYFEMQEVKFCHLGELGHVLTSEMVKEIGDVDILMMDLGDKSNLNTKKAMEIVEAIEPRVLIAMGSGNLKEKLKELGADKIESHEVFAIKSTKDLPEDKRLYVVLKKS
jgi:L-ascorbate metabolism protein UlaG (beta-lactamase superfamily)